MKPSNVLRIESLGNDWSDKDIVILHACFQLLKDFVEKEKEIIEQIDWECDEETKKAKEEIDFLYNWWLHRAKIEYDLDLEDYKKQYDEVDQMLKRLIYVRQHLWS